MRKLITRIIKWLAAVTMLAAMSAPASASWGIGGSGGTPALQAVTDVGAVTTNAIEAATGTFTNIVVDSPDIITYPSAIYTAGHFEATAVCLTYGGNDYTGAAGATYTLFVNVNDNQVVVGAPSSANAEPKNISAYFDGTQDLDIILFTYAGDRYTAVESATNTAQYEADLVGAGGVINLTIPSAYTANGATSSYTFNLSTVTGAGATLWGGDGANGERTEQATSPYVISANNKVGFGVPFPDSQLAVMPTENVVVAKFIGSVGQGEHLIDGSTSTGTIVFAVGVDGTIASRGNRIVISTFTTPATSTYACEIGSIYWDVNYLYVCTSTNNWKRATLDAF